MSIAFAPINPSFAPLKTSAVSLNLATYTTVSYPISLIHQLSATHVGFGCSHRHGHDFKVEVTLANALDKTSEESLGVHGSLNLNENLTLSTKPSSWREELDQIVKDHILKPFQGALMNDHLPSPTGEGIALLFYTILKSTKLGQRLIAVQLRETRKNQFLIAKQV